MAVRVKTVLPLKFKENTQNSRRPATLIAWEQSQIHRTEDLLRIKHWLKEVIQTLKDEASVDTTHPLAPKPRQALSEATKAANISREIAEKNDVFALDGDIIMDNLTRSDLAGLKSKLCELHRVCKARDIAITLAGFDLLPRSHTSFVDAFNNGSCTYHNPEFTNHDRNPVLEILVEYDRPYNFGVNPYSDTDIEQKFDDLNMNLPVSKPK